MGLAARAGLPFLKWLHMQAKQDYDAIVRQQWLKLQQAMTKAPRCSFIMTPDAVQGFPT